MIVIVCSLLCLRIDSANAASAHSVKGVVITRDGTVVPEFSVVLGRVAGKPELLQRKHFKNGEFTLDGLTGDRYELKIAAPLFITSKTILDFTSKSKPTDYCIIILHTFRNERRLTPAETYSVSVKVLQEKIPDTAANAYRKAVELHQNGKLEEAMIEYGKAVRAYPRYVEALSDLGTIFILYNRPESALVFLRRAQEIDDANPIINLNIAIALTEQGEYGDALKLLNKVLRDQPQMAPAHLHMGNIYYQKKQYEKAEHYLCQAVEIDPGLLDAWLLLVHVRLEQRKYDEARESLMHIREAMNNKVVAEFIDEQLLALGS